MDGRKLMVIVLIGASLAVFGFMVYSGQKKKSVRLASAPIAVAAIRGTNEAGVSSNASGATISDYTQALKGNVTEAERKTEAFNDATDARMEEARKALDAGN